MVAILTALAALAIWAYLIAGRGGFWLAAERDAGFPALPAWPAVTAVIPARDEAQCVGEAIGSLLRQDYPGPFSIILVDDQSTDGTAEVARQAAAAAGCADRLTVLSGAALPAGWTGKMWAMKQGIECAQASAPTYFLLTDADIVYAPDALSGLVSKAQAEGLVLSSLMVRLRCESFAERALIPAFVFFFQMLYPFAWVNRKDRTTAAAAGGCMLVRGDALRAAGGIEAIRGALIDDCALALRMKQQGPIRLGLTDRVRSIRAYPAWQDIRLMVARSAYAQLRYSPLLLAGTVAGMALTYVAPVLLALFGDGLAQPLGLLVWAIMAIAFQPTLRLYRASPLWGPLLPVIALAYMAFTLEFRLSIRARARRPVERPRSGESERRAMTNMHDLRSGKSHRDENFPVASRLIHSRHRALILAFYEFVRTADDIADHAELSAQQKLDLLDRLEADLLGASDGSPQAVALRIALANRGLSAQHAQDLLKAFRLDATKRRYADWNDLMDYCALSAMPVGRFVLDVHGESRSTWPASDAICAALQIINHLQDCAADYRNLDRVYVPLDALAAAGLGVEALGENQASPSLRGCLAGLAKRTTVLLNEGDALPVLIEDWRLGLEISVIHALAQHLCGLLVTHDPLSERTHLGKLGAAGISLLAVLKGASRRLGRRARLPASASHR